MANKEVVRTPASSDKLAAQPPQHLAKIEVAPEWMPRGNQGMEDVGQRDVAMPRLAIAQKSSPVMEETNPLFIEGLKLGDFYNTVTGEIYGSSFEFTPLFFTKQRIWFKKMEEGGGILCQSLNGLDGGQVSSRCVDQLGNPVCEKARFVDGKRPDCTELHNFVAAGRDNYEPIAVSLKSTGIAAAKQINAWCKLGGVPMFGRRFKLTTVKETKNGQTYFKAVATNLGFVKSKEIFDALRGLHDNLRSKPITIDMTGEGAEADESFDTQDM